MAHPRSSDAAILFGGSGPERLVSVATAQSFCAHLDEAELWFLGTDGACTRVSAADLLEHPRPFEEPLTPRHAPFASTLEAAIVEARRRSLVLVLGLHGGEGEDGRLAAQLEAADVAFTGSGSEASAKAFDKSVAKAIASDVGARVPPAFVLAADDRTTPPEVSEWVAVTGVVAKPVRDGSSHGLRFLLTATQLADFLQRRDRSEYLIEPMVHGVEATVGVLDDDDGARGLEPVEIRLPSGATFDYQSKYLDARTEELCPSTFDRSVIDALKTAAVRVHRAIGAEGYSRSDFIVPADGQPVFLEINTLPGMTRSSLFPRELAVAGISMRDFLLQQINRAASRTARP